MMFASGALTDDYGCKAILCLASPGGPKQFAECVPTIERLHRDLSRGKPFPPCDMGGSDAVTVEQGVQEYLTCGQVYGDEYEPYNPPEDTSDTDRHYSICTSFFTNMSNYADGFSYNECTVCRKNMGTRKEYICDELDNGNEANCRYVDVQLYDTKPVIRNNDPRYVQVKVRDANQQEQEGERFYYRVKK
jgi:hypothetical protein